MHDFVNVEVQRRAEALDQRNRAGAGGLLRVAGLPDQVRGNDAIDDAEHTADQRRMCREQKAQRKRKTQHPLPDRPLGQYLIDQPGSPVGHAPGTTAGAEACACN